MTQIKSSTKNKQEALHLIQIVYNSLSLKARSIFMLYHFEDASYVPRSVFYK